MEPSAKRSRFTGSFSLPSSIASLNAPDNMSDSDPEIKILSKEAEHKAKKTVRPRSAFEQTTPQPDNDLMDTHSTEPQTSSFVPFPIYTAINDMSFMVSKKRSRETAFPAPPLVSPPLSSEWGSPFLIPLVLPSLARPTFSSSFYGFVGHFAI